MKKLPPITSSLVLAALVVLPLRASVSPSSAQPVQEEQDERVAALETELQALKKRHDETRALLEQTLVYLEKQSRAATALLAVVDEAERQGFAVGENWASRKTLLTGFRAYWGEEQAGLPKVPKAPAAPAATPEVPARQPRQ